MSYELAVCSSTTCTSELPSVQITCLELSADCLQATEVTSADRGREEVRRVNGQG